MAIAIERDPIAEAPFERCCFCRRPSAHWHTPKDVAVCPACAEVREDSDVPSKEGWCASEAARSDSYFRWLA